MNLRWTRWLLMGTVVAGFLAGALLVAPSSLFVPAKSDAQPTATPFLIAVPTPYPARSAALIQANSKQAWNCGWLKSNNQYPTFNSACATKAWIKRKPFRLNLNWYEPHHGSYAGYLIGDKNRRLYLSLDYSTSNGVWKIEKEIKNAFVAKKRDKEMLYWKNQEQDFGVTFPDKLPR